MVNFVSVDIETTGFSHMYDTILQIGAVKINNGKVIDRFNRYIYTSKKIPQQLVEITGITNDLLNSKGEPYAQVLEDFLNFIEEYEIIAHNASFDFRFLERKVGSKLNRKIRNNVRCSMKLAKMHLGKKVPNHKLETVASYLKIPNGNHHDALNDAEVCADIVLVICGRELQATVATNPLEEIMNEYSIARRNNKY